MDRKRCPKCNRLIVVVTTVAGRLMPLDPEPNAFGNVVLERAIASDSGIAVGARRARMLKRDDPVSADAERWMPHFDTCRKANSAAGATA